jgi:hypothetical protein
MYPYRKVSMSFDIGRSETHSVELWVDKLFDSVKIKIDGIESIKEMIPIWSYRTKDYSLNVGKKEKHQVTVRITKPFLFSPKRSWKYSILVDGKKLRRKEVDIFQHTLI